MIVSAIHSRKTRPTSVPRPSFRAKRGAAVALMACALMLQPSDTFAQFWDKLSNPEYEVPIAHPPQIIWKGPQKVIVSEFEGTGGSELTERFKQALTASGKIEVIDRGNLDTILKEQGIQSSASFNPSSAAKVGELLGAGAIFVGKVSRFTAEQSPVLQTGTVNSSTQGQLGRYERKLTVRLTASIQLVDLATGKTHTGQLVEASKVLTTEAVGGAPEPPSKEEAVTAVYAAAVEQMKRMVLPWTETVKLIVYNGGKLGLDKSAAQIKAGDFNGAVECLQAVLTNKLSNPKDEKLLYRAYYNLGIAQIYAGFPEQAVPTLQKSIELRSTDIATKGLKTAREVLQLKQQQERLESQAVQLGASPEPSPAESKVKRLGNKDIIGMTEAKLPDSIIIAKIKSSRGHFDTSTDGLIALKKGGVSDAVVLEITQLPDAQKEQ